MNDRSEATNGDVPEVDLSKAPTFQAALDTFLKDIRALARAYPLTTKAMEAGWHDAASGFTHVLSEYCHPDDLEKVKRLTLPPQTSGTIEIRIEIPSTATRSFLAKAGDIIDMASAGDLVRRSFIFTLVSQYDAYVGNVIRTIFHIRPEILNASEKALSYSQLRTFASIENAAQHIVDREVEGILRESHASHFEWLERKLNLKLKNRLDVWPQFIELTERRNLFAHGNGIVSQQYLTVCSLHGVTSDSSTRVGSQLTVDDEYFERSYECLFELGFKLAHVLWRVLKKDERPNADSDINRRTLDLIVEGRYPLAIKLLEFFLDGMKKEFSSERVRLVALINLAQSYKWLGDTEKCLDVLKRQDWSAAAPDFLLAVSVLKDDFSGAAKHVRKLGQRGEIGGEEFKHWPIFRHFIRSAEFLDAYQEVFQKPFEPPIDDTVQLTVREEAKQIAPVTCP